MEAIMANSQFLTIECNQCLRRVNWDSLTPIPCCACGTTITSWHPASPVQSISPGYAPANIATTTSLCPACNKYFSTPAGHAVPQYCPTCTPPASAFVGGWLPSMPPTATDPKDSIPDQELKVEKKKPWKPNPFAPKGDWRSEL